MLSWFYFYYVGRWVLSLGDDDDETRFWYQQQQQQQQRNVLVPIRNKTMNKGNSRYIKYINCVGVIRGEKS